MCRGIAASCTMRSLSTNRMACHCPSESEWEWGGEMEEGFNKFIHCRVERSSDQVIKPVNLEALSKWVGHIPEDVVRDMAEIAPMLSILNYDPYSNPPDYGKPDSWVKDNTYKV